MVLIYMLGWLDRVNVSFAALTMNRDLALSPGAYGVSAGIFFLGYFAFQIPSNVAAARFGVSRVMFWSMLLWGLISAAHALVRGPASLIALRFLLGIAEAGFFPAMIFYLTLWFPRAYRARFTAAFMTAIPLATIIGAPLSTLILGSDGFGGLRGWQWLFIIEGLPACLLALFLPALLADGPHAASWLSPEEKLSIATELNAEKSDRHHDIAAALRDSRILGLSIVSFLLGFAGYGIGLWLPQILQSFGYSNSETGALIAGLFGIGICAMVLWGRSSDRSGDRVWHVIIATLLAAAGFVVVSQTETGVTMLIAFACVAAGFLSADGPFFALPSGFLSGATAAAAIALINAVGGLGAFAGPAIIGLFKQTSGDYEAAMILLAGVLVAGAGIMFALRKQFRGGPDAAVPDRARPRQTP